MTILKFLWTYLSLYKDILFYFIPWYSYIFISFVVHWSCTERRRRSWRARFYNENPSLRTFAESLRLLRGLNAPSPLSSRPTKAKTRSEIRLETSRKKENRRQLLRSTNTKHQNEQLADDLFNWELYVPKCFLGLEISLAVNWVIGTRIVEEFLFE